MMKISRKKLPGIYPISLILLITSGCFKDAKLPDVTTGIVSNITSTSAIISDNANGDGGGYVSGRGICWSNILTEPNIKEDEVYYEGFGAGTFSVYIANLTPGTKYYTRAFAKNNEGTGYGQVVSFTTLGSVTGEIVFNPDSTYKTITDITGNVYNTIRIGTQTWMAENLRTTKLTDGSDIPNVTANDEWKRLQTPGYCWYLNDDKYMKIYGALYNWYAVSSDKLCPDGWHVPRYDEWTTLFSFIGNNYEVANKLRETGNTHWVNTDASVSNSTGFTALPGGWRNIDNINFGDLGYAGTFWAVPEAEGNINTTMFFFQGSLEGIFFAENSKNSGLSVRCIKD